VAIPPTPEEVIRHFDRALSLANLAVRDNPKRYELWVYRASLYISLIQYAFEDASARARPDISEAEELAPSTPEIPYVRALLEVKEGNVIAAREALLRALALKPDYAEAKNLLTELQNTVP
jgi:tetratricopeptide (TPR) repeat protein